MRKILILGLCLYLQAFALDFGSKKVTIVKNLKCAEAGYSYEQGNRVAAGKCLSLEDIKDYMSSNTYMDIKMGEPAKNLKDFIKIIEPGYPIIDEHVRNFSDYSNYGIRCSDEAYLKRTQSVTIVVCTRYGLVDTIVAKFPAGLDTQKDIQAKLDQKYKVAEASRDFKKYNGLLSSSRTTLRIYKNGEDNIALSQNTEYNKNEPTLVIFSSNAYDFINVYQGEGKDKTIKKTVQDQKKAIDAL